MAWAEQGLRGVLAAAASVGQTLIMLGRAMGDLGAKAFGSGSGTIASDIQIISALRFQVLKCSSVAVPDAAAC